MNREKFRNGLDLDALHQTVAALKDAPRLARFEFRALSTELEGTIDLQGLLDLDPDATVGYEQIRIRMHVEADCSDEELDALLDFAQRHSPVCNTVCRPVPVVVERV